MPQLDKVEFMSRLNYQQADLSHPSIQIFALLRVHISFWYLFTPLYIMCSSALMFCLNVPAVRRSALNR